MSTAGRNASPLRIANTACVFTSRLYTTTSTVIETPTEIIVVDPNWLPDEVERIRDLVYNLRDGRKLVLLFTHSDYDHIIGYGAFDADIVIASIAFRDKVNKTKDISDAIRSDQEYKVFRDYPLIYPEVDVAADRVGFELKLSGTTLTCYLAPGHTPEGIIVVAEPQGIIIAGDYFSDVEFPLVSDISNYRKTLDKLDFVLQHHNIHCLVPGHGTVATGAAAMLQRKAEALEYLADLERLSTGSEFPEPIYSRRYPNWDKLHGWHDENIQKLHGVK